MSDCNFEPCSWYIHVAHNLRITEIPVVDAPVGLVGTGFAHKYFVVFDLIFIHSMPKVS